MKIPVNMEARHSSSPTNSEVSISGLEKKPQMVILKYEILSKDIQQNILNILKFKCAYDYE